MTEKQLHKLHKTELLGVILALSEKVDALKEENESLKNKLKTKGQTIDRTFELVKALCAQSGCSEESAAEDKEVE